MNKRVSVILVVATMLVILGIAVLACTMIRLNWDFTALSTTKFETKTHILDRDFSRIAINTDTTDVRICLSEDGQGKLVVTQQENLSYRVQVENGMLTVTMEDARKWYEHISLFSFGESGITLYLPKTDYESLQVDISTGDVTVEEKLFIGDVYITTTTGDIRLEDLTADTIKLELSTGDITVASVTCHKDVQIDSTTGDVYLYDLQCENLITTGTTSDLTIKEGTAKAMVIRRSTGDVYFQNVDAGEISVEITTGDVSGSLRTDKIFNVQTTTGDVNVPKSGTGGLCDITTTTGDIHIHVS